MLTDRGMNQVNIHLVLSQESFRFACEVLNDRLSDSRLKNMNAIVFLAIKPKGKAKGNFHSLDFDKFCKLVLFSMSLNISIGFDSCSAPKFDKFIRESNLAQEFKDDLLEFSESCESAIFSSYINYEGKFFPCSFCEGENEWKDGISVLEANSFSEIWKNPRVKEWRKKLLDSTKNGCRNCLAFPEIN
jgi:radical SAM protein with 4Fe4S-binding SPASM domain